MLSGVCAGRYGKYFFPVGILSLFGHSLALVYREASVAKLAGPRLLVPMCQQCWPDNTGRLKSVTETVVWKTYIIKSNHRTGRIGTRPWRHYDVTNAWNLPYHLSVNLSAIAHTVIIPCRTRQKHPPCCRLWQRKWKIGRAAYQEAVL